MLDLDDTNTISYNNDNTQITISKITHTQLINYCKYTIQF